MKTFDILWLIPIIPLLGAAINGIFGNRLSKNAIGIIAALVISTVLDVAMAAVMPGMVPYDKLDVPAPAAVRRLP